MSNIDKQSVQAVADLKAGYTLGHADVAILNELARIALASLEAEPVGEVVLGEYDDCGCHPDARVVCIAADGQADWENFKDGTRLYAAPPSLAAIDERAAFNTWNNDENLPIAGVGAKNAAWLAWQARAKLTSPPAPVSVPDELTREEYKRRFMEDDNFDDTFRGGWNACRATMLQGAEHVSNRDELPDGWVAVPVEPTAEMYDAGDRQLATKQVWDAMIAAAPQWKVK